MQQMKLTYKKALEKLQNYLDGESQCVPFYEALEKGAKALGDSNE